MDGESLSKPSLNSSFVLLIPILLLHKTFFVSLLQLILSSICFMLGFCCYGPHTLMGLIVMESAPPQLKGTTHSLSTTVATSK